MEGKNLRRGRQRNEGRDVRERPNTSSATMEGGRAIPHLPAPGCKATHFQPCRSFKVI